MAQQNSISNQSSELTIDPAAASDSFIQLNESTVAKWKLGNDATDDSWRLNQGSTLGDANDVFIMTSAGERTMPLQPAFLTTNNADQSNVTGDGTIYTATFVNEIFDQNSDFDGTSTFNAPVTGRYDFKFGFFFGGIAAAHNNCFIYLETSNATYRAVQIDFSPGQDVGGLYVLSGSVTADMDASDTALIKVRFLGGAKTIDIQGATSSAFRTPYFTAFLIC